MFLVDQFDSGLLDSTERTYFAAGVSKYYQHVTALYESKRIHSFVKEFASLSLDSIHPGSAKSVSSHTGFSFHHFVPPPANHSLSSLLPQDLREREDILLRLFNASVKTCFFQSAYSALVQLKGKSVQHSCLTTFITSVVAENQAGLLVSLPFVELHKEVDEILVSLCQKMLNIATSPPYHQVLYSWRISRGDFRGAATILYDRLQRLQTSSTSLQDPEDESVAQCFLMLINALA